jgi:molybdenum cofactor biosynthesis enzyme MoaA
MRRWLQQMWEYLSFGVEFFVIHRDRPYILGLVTNDTCNLHCIHCRVANVYHYNMTIDKIRTVLEQYYQKGVRFLYLEGGEPYV